MAIRDFGTSLLSNVRARKDAQLRDARKYARSQKKKDLIKGLLLPPIASGLSELMKIGNSAVVEKTQDFLASSDLYANKLNVSKAEKLITEATGYRDSAQTQGTSIYDVMLNQKATEAATQREIASPNTVKPGMVEEWRAMYMEREDVKNQARLDSDYFESILKKADRFSIGREKKTLDSLASEARPKTVVGALWNKLTGDATSLDVFNTTMSKLEQVTVANEIAALSLEKRKRMGEAILNNGGDPSVAKMVAGAPANLAELEAIAASADRGEKREDQAPTINISSNGVYVTTTTKVTQQNGNVRLESSVTQEYTPEEAMSSSDLATVLAKQGDIFESVSKRFNAAGAKDFALAIDNYLQNKPENKNKLEPLDVLYMASLAAQPLKWTKEENIIAPLNPEVARALVDQTDEVTSVVQQVVASQLQISKNRPLTLEEREKLVSGISLLQTHLNDTVFNILNIKSRPSETQLEPFPEEPPKPSWLPQNVDTRWSETRQGWFSAAPNQDGVYVQYTKGDD